MTRIALLTVFAATIAFAGISPAIAKPDAPARVDVAAIQAYPVSGQVKDRAGRPAAAARSAAASRQRHQAKEARQAAPEASYGQVGFIAHPAGCPWRNFCACGAAVEIFGQARRDLWPVAAWYGFPRVPHAEAGPRMIAIMHRHHLVVLDHQISGSEWMTLDFNSGGHLSRRQVQNIANATIVNPRGNLANYSARRHHRRYATR